MTDLSPAYHYQVIARALEVIDVEGPALTLEALAQRMTMSPAHFQRVFSQWVGVSPKRYQQYLTLGHARRRLAERHTMLGPALATGLSGTGRLHDLSLTWEAMSPGDYARGGAGLKIRWGWFDGPFGPALVMATDRGSRSTIAGPLRPPSALGPGGQAGAGSCHETTGGAGSDTLEG